MRTTKEVKLCQPPTHLKVHLIVGRIFPVKGSCLHKAGGRAIDIVNIRFSNVSYSFCFILLFHFFFFFFYNASSCILVKFILG